MISDPWFYAVAIPAVVLSGLGKGGLSGLGNISVPLMALVISPIQAAAIMLPILLAGDWVSIWAFRRNLHWPNLRILFPAGAAGILIGWAMAAHITDTQVRLLVGVIGVAFTLSYWLGSATRRAAPAPDPVKGGFWGVLTGITSFLIHGGGPPYAVYMLPQRLPNTLYAGTTAIFFAFLNHAKIPAYILLGQFSAENLKTAGILLPLTWTATLAGIWIVRRIDRAIFYRITYVTLFVVSAKLLWDGVRTML